MRIVVTGRDGQLGQALAHRLAGRSDIEFIGLGRADFDLEVPGSAASALARVRPDLVVNCAAFTAVDAAEREPDRAFRVNADGAGEVARAARLASAAVIHVSTDYVFDGSAASPYAEDRPARPLNVYGRSKHAGEGKVRLEQPDHLILRTAWLFSPAGNNFVKTILERAAEGAALTVVNDQYGSPTSAAEVAAGIIRVVDSWRAGDRSRLGKTMHLAGGGEASWFDLAQAALGEAARFGWPSTELRPVSSAYRPSPARRPTRSTLDSSRFLAAFGLPMTPWEDAVKGVVREIVRARPRPRQLQG